MIRSLGIPVLNFLDETKYITVRLKSRGRVTNVLVRTSLLQIDYNYVSENMQRYYRCRLVSRLSVLSIRRNLRLSNLTIRIAIWRHRAAEVLS